MAFAFVHFTVGFVAALVVVSAFPITRYRLTVAYGGGTWALLPDGHHVVDGALGQRIRALHDGPQADLFFLHRALDAEVFRANNVEVTFLSLVVLGATFVGYDRRFGVGRSRGRLIGGAEESDDVS